MKMKNMFKLIVFMTISNFEIVGMSYAAEDFLKEIGDVKYKELLERYEKFPECFEEEFARMLGLTDIPNFFNFQSDMPIKIQETGFDVVLKNAINAKDPFLGTPYFNIIITNEKVMVERRYANEFGYRMLCLSLYKKQDGSFSHALLGRSGFVKSLL